jgi:hypothetical protein
VRVVAADPGSDLFEAFVQLPWRIYPDRYLWVPASKQGTRAELSDDNPFFSHGRAQAYVCLQGGNAVGRIVASIDDRRVDNSGIGHFGYFESIDCERVAHELLEHAEHWLRSQGRRRVEGPVDLNIWTRYRIQVAGFDRVPYAGEPRSPPYYRRLLEACGYRERMRWNSYDFDRTELTDLCEFFAWRRAIRYERCRPSTDFRRMQWTPGPSTLSDLHAVIMSCWPGNYGFSYIDEHEFARTLAGLVDILEPSLCALYRDDTSVSAFRIGHLDRRAGLAIMKAYGVVPGHRKTHLVYEVLRDLTSQARAVARLPAVLSLATEQSDLWRRFKAPTRMHAVYGKDLTL